MTRAVLVESLKGGTGKTVISINMARLLSESGRTALIDADIDSPNFSDFIDIDDKVRITKEGKEFSPVDWDGIKVFSMSLLAESDKSISMSGERYGKIINEAVTRSDWGEPDFIVIDMPAGASDIYRRLVEVFADYMTGSVVVTTPASVSDTRRVLRLHELSGVPVLGIIENMAYLECDCGREHKVFGESPLEKLESDYDVRSLGRVPLIEDVRDNVFFEDGVEAIENAVESVIELEEEKVGILGRIKKGIKDMTVEKVGDIASKLVTMTNEQIDLSKYQEKHGFTGGKPVFLVVTNRSREKELLRTRLVVEDGKLLIDKRRGAKTTAEIVLDTSTLARIIMGSKKVGDHEVSYDAWDAWLSGDVDVYGRGTTPWTIRVLRRLFEDETLLRELKGSYGSILSPLT